MRVCHGFNALSARFDDPNLVICGGLAPVLALAQWGGVHRLVAEHVRIGGEGGANAAVKVASLVAGMVAGAAWPRMRRCCPAPTRSATSMWTTNSGGSPTPRPPGAPPGPAPWHRQR